MGFSPNDPRKAGTIWMLDLAEDVPVIEPRVEAEFQRAGREVAEELAAIMEGASFPDVLGRFESGRWCYTARVEGKLAAYGWVSFKEEYVGELRLRLRLKEGEAYIWDCATIPAFRRLGLYSSLLSYIIQDLRRRAGGLERAWIGANLDNEPSQRGIARAGFHRVAGLIVERVLGMRQVWVEGWPGVPEALVNDARRVFLSDRDKIWLSTASHAAS